MRSPIVASTRKGLHEVRTRVTCHLPVGRYQEEMAFFKVIAYLDQQRDEGIGVNGYTHSILRPAVFRGYWWPTGANEPVRDEIVLLLVDYLLDFSDQRLSAKVAELKRTVRKWYRHHGSPQEEFWIVAQQVIRQD
jgi:hypothetical protein